MNPEIKEKWIEALRSGKYQHGKCKLRKIDDSYCCLGVLCDIAVKEGIIKWEYVRQYGYFNTVNDNGHRGSNALPIEVKEWAGLEYCDPVIKWDGLPTCISILNDSEETKGFEDIIPYIEEQL